MIKSLIQHITKLTGDNQFMAAAISAWILGVFTFLLRNVPSRFFSFLKKHLTTSFSISSYHQAYYLIMEWLAVNNKLDRLRRVNLMCGRWGDASKPAKTIGPGKHVIWYKRCPLLLSLDKEEASATDRDKWTLTISLLGRSHTFFDRMLTDITTGQIRDNTKTCISVLGRECWSEPVAQPVRSMESIILPVSTKIKIISSIEDFQSKEQWYTKRGIPYHFGLLLYGPPGTGKTSLVKAIAAELDCDIYVVPPGNLCSLDNQDLSKVTINHITLIEDIDANTIIHKREDVPNTKNRGEVSTHTLLGSISDVLNAMDGIISHHGRILVMTTNRIKTLDTAILRPGRVDLKIEVGYVNNEMFCQFLKLFFDVTLKEDSFCLLSDSLTVATLQQEFLEGKPLEYFLDTYTKIERKDYD